MDYNKSSHIYRYDNISSKFHFQDSGLKVKVDMIFSIMWDLIPPNLKIWMFTILYLNVKVKYDLYITVTGFLFLHSHNYYMSWNSPVQCLPTSSSLVQGDLYHLRCLVTVGIYSEDTFSHSWLIYIWLRQWNISDLRNWMFQGWI